MGCSNSSEEKVAYVDPVELENHDKFERFKKREESGEPLATSLRDSYDAFLCSCQMYESRHCDAVEGSEVTFDVNTSVEEANEKGLTFQVASDTASDFLGHAMVRLGLKNFGGNVDTDLCGAAGEPSELRVLSLVKFDRKGNKDEEPESVEQKCVLTFKFFCAEE